MSASVPPPSIAGDGVVTRFLLGNISVLLWSHLAGLAAAFVTVPYLARVLRPEGWGPVLLAQALATWLVLLIEYAFDLSVTRRLAEARGAGGPDGPLVRTVADATSARLMLAAVAFVVWAGAVAVVPALAADWRMAAAALVFALARGFTPLWYFLGVERVHRAVLIDTAGRVVGALAVFLLVQHPSHGWRVLGAQALAAVVACLLLNRQLRQELPALRETPRVWAGGVAVLRDGITLFAARASGSLYMQLNTLFIGAVASPVTVAMFGGAERIVRAGVSLLDPVTRVLVARLSYLQGVDRAAASRLAARLVIVLGTGAAVAAAGAAALAPWFVGLLLGPGYDAAVPVFRLLLLVLPIIALATSIGIFFAVPRGHDRIVLSGTMAAGGTNLLLALPLARRFGASGMAMSVVIAEAVVATMLVVWYWRQRRGGAA